MRVLILGGSGMLGHKLWQAHCEKLDVYVTVRHGMQSYARFKLFEPQRTIGHVSAENLDSILQAVRTVRPQIVVNCIGIVKQAPAAADPLRSIAINALFPHRLAQICGAGNVRLIHISTDCVFSGTKGNYVEGDVADAGDLYGRTKFLGEVGGEGCLTLRTSMIGRELETSHGLIEWFLAQEGKKVPGYARAIFSGFTTLALAEIISGIITEQPDLHGVWHVASEPISKFDLLSLVKERGRISIQIQPDERVVCDRSLNADRFRKATGFIPPSWSDMVARMFDDSTPYTDFRKNLC